jgi:type VI secretion system secreted protein Hcp
VAVAALARPRFSDLSFMHGFDKASPALMTACATGAHIKDATLTARKAGKGQQEYIIVKLSDILITSVPALGQSEHPMESVSMQFSKVDLEYKPQKPTARSTPACTSSTTSRATRKASRFALAASEKA